MLILFTMHFHDILYPAGIKSNAHTTLLQVMGALLCLFAFSGGLVRLRNQLIPRRVHCGPCRCQTLHQGLWPLISQHQHIFHNGSQLVENVLLKSQDQRECYTGRSGLWCSRNSGIHLRAWGQLCDPAAKQRFRSLAG